MFISNDEAQARLANPRNLLAPPPPPGIIVPKGKPPGTKPRSVDEKVTIGTLAGLISTKEVARMLNMHPSYVSSMKHGKNSDSSPNPEVKRRVDENLGRVEDAAIGITMRALGLIDDDKLYKLQATELAILAKNTATVAEKVRPREKNDGPQVQVLFYAPKETTEDDFKVIEVEAKPA